MKETIKINLSQRLFDLDADAYENLKEYLDALKKIFDRSPEESEEILHDIEQRIADLLQEKLGSSKQVVTNADIEEVIKKLGTAEDFARENGQTESENFTSGSEEKGQQGDSFQRAHRKFYRDIDNNIIGGVCSGLGAYFNIDPVWIRVALLLLFFLKGFGLLIYIILWAVVPSARTTAQKLQMKGRPVTVENIQDSVKREFTKVKDNFSRYSESENYRKTQNTIAEIFRTLGNIFLVFLKIILILIGVGIIIAGISLIIALFTTLAGGSFITNWHWQGPDFWNLFHFQPHEITLFSMAVLLVILIPIIAIPIGLVKLIFNVKTRNNVLAAFVWTFWALALVFVLVTVFTGDKIFSYRSGYIDEKEIDLPVNKVLYIELENDSRRLRGTTHYTFFGREIVHDKFYDKCYLKPIVSFRPSDRNEMYMSIEYRTAFPDFQDDYNNEIYYEWELVDSLLLLNEYFSLDDDEIWQGPGVKVTLFVPEGQKFRISRNLEKIVDEHESPLTIYDHYYGQELQIRDSEVVVSE
jgi:phage shock protein PspC (stress-responsive transcriptional regulator)